VLVEEAELSLGDSVTIGPLSFEVGYMEAVGGSDSNSGAAGDRDQVWEQIAAKFKQKQEAA
jgi:hypothetical protein